MPGAAVEMDYKVTVELEVSESPADVNSNIATVKTNIAAAISGVDETDISIVVAAKAARMRRLSGSRLFVDMAADNEADANAIEAAAAVAMPNAANASSITGLTVTAVPVVAVYSEVVVVEKVETMPGYAIPLIIVCAILALLCAVFVVVLVRKEQAGSPVFTTLKVMDASRAS